MKKNAGQPVAAGFTLIEMLVIILIIALLVSMLLPSIMKAKDIARRSADKGTIAALDRACETFAEENKGTYPASTVQNATHKTTKTCSDNTTVSFQNGGPNFPGACLLFDQLVRNMDSADVLIPGKSKADMYEVGSIKTAQFKHPTTTGVMVDAYYFVDSFGNPILYYSYCTDLIVAPAVYTPRYWDEHNPADTVNKFAPPPDKSIDLPAQPCPPLPNPQPAPMAPLVNKTPYSRHWNAAKSSWDYYRGRTKTDPITGAVNGADFILISPGKDGKYVAADGDPANKTKWPYDPNTDDVTNLSR